MHPGGRGMAFSVPISAAGEGCWETLQDIVWTLKMCWDPVSLVSHGLGEETGP